MRKARPNGIVEDDEGGHAEGVWKTGLRPLERTDSLQGGAGSGQGAERAGRQKVIPPRRGAPESDFCEGK